MIIGIVGMGVVGSAIASAHDKLEIRCYDKFKDNACHRQDELYETELCFVCVPTPTIEGKQDLSAIIEVFGNFWDARYKGIVVLKSTVLPNTTRSLADRYPWLRIVHNPEFLSAACAKLDYCHQRHALISGHPRDREVVKKYFQNRFSGIEVHESIDYETTEIAKYIHNCLLAVQLSFLNEVYELNPSHYLAAAKMASHLGNLNQYFKVPGPDGKRGWGGMCFPKDTEALISHADTLGVRMDTLRWACASNKRMRTW